MSRRQKVMSQARLSMNNMSRHKLANFYSRFVKVRREINFITEWRKLCRDLGSSTENSETVGRILVGQYEQPHRHYHDIQHIEDCLVLLQVCNANLYNGDYNILRYSLFMHDAVYDTWSKGNEERSVDFSYFCVDRLNLPYSPVEPFGFMDKVSSCIYATQHSELVEDYLQQLCADIDLFGMSRDWNTFIANERKVRQEFFWTTDEEFVMGNSEIMRGLLERKHIYQTEWFRDNFEKVAQANIARLLQERGL